MSKGKILKIRIGHEANCSSGMVAMFMLMVGGVTYLPLSVTTAAVQASKLSTGALRGGKGTSCWIIPQVLGLVVTAFLVYGSFTSGYGVSGPLSAALAMGVSFALAVTVGYVLASRIKYWVCLVSPLILTAGFVLFYMVSAWVQELLWRMRW